VDDFDCGCAGPVQKPGGDWDHVGPLDLGTEHGREGTVSTHEVVLEIHRNNGSAPWFDVNAGHAHTSSQVR
jgi:hypothetical protein